ncbi:MAG: type II toxin-antitoxin system PemK/MazF family toxin [bacterium]|nr:type II toxin-antitoxin system PemK/MazF family toxin [bacterium]
MDTELEEITKKTKQNEDNKKAKLLQAFENNLKISGMNLTDKYESFENWEYDKSNRLLYEISLSQDKKYMRYPRGSIIKVDFGVNVGSEFSQQHFAITLSKRDSIYCNTVKVIPLTSKVHKNYINLNDLISRSYITSLQDKLTKLQQELDEIDIDNCEFNPNYKKEIKEIEKILKYYKSIKNNLSYACVDQIRTVSKLNILKPINKYDIVGNYKCPPDIMESIDMAIVKNYTSIDYREFEKYINQKNEIDKEEK